METACNKTCHASRKFIQKFSDDRGWAKPQSILHEYHYKCNLNDNAQNDLTNYGNEDQTKTVRKQTVNLSEFMRDELALSCESVTMETS